DHTAHRACVGGRPPVRLGVGGGCHVQVRLVHHLAHGAGARGAAVDGQEGVRAGRQRGRAEGGLAVAQGDAGQDGAAVQGRDRAGGGRGAAQGQGDGGGEGHRLAVDRGAGQGRQGEIRVGGLHLEGADVGRGRDVPGEAALVGGDAGRDEGVAAGV